MRSRLRVASQSGGDAAAGAAPTTRAALSPEALFGEAGRFLAAANSLDTRRPQINAWLAICEAEMGREAVVKQTIRHALRFGWRLDTATALQLATKLLGFSDEAAAYPGERGKYVQDGRYADEIAAVTQLLLQGAADVPSAQVGEAHYLLARVHEMHGKDVDALVEYRLAIPKANASQARQDEIFERGRVCAKRLIAEPSWAELLETDIAAALVVRQHRTNTSDGDDAIVADLAEGHPGQSGGEFES